MEPNQSFEETIILLAETLNQERSDLLAGQYSNLSDYAESKSLHLSHLSAYLADRDIKKTLTEHKQKIVELQKFASENEKILLSTKQGVKSAQERLAHLDSIETVVGTYTECGGQLRMQTTATTCKKIA